MYTFKPISNEEITVYWIEGIEIRTGTLYREEVHILHECKNIALTKEYQYVQHNLCIHARYKNGSYMIPESPGLFSIPKDLVFFSKEVVWSKYVLHMSELIDKEKEKLNQSS